MIMAKHPGSMNFIQGNGPFGARTLAIILMVLGAAGFVISLLAFGEQVLCLVGSTIIVFVGLGIVCAARKNTNNPTSQESQMNASDEATMPAWGEKKPYIQSPAPRQWREPHQSVEKPVQETTRTPEPSDLLNRVSMVFRSQGADIVLEMERNQRSVLRSAVHGGLTYVIMVDEGIDEIQISDLRALYSVWVNHGSDGAIFISISQFSAQAIEWARTRAIILLSEDMLESFVLPG